MRADTTDERATTAAVAPGVSLYARHTVTDATWRELTGFLDDKQLIALPMLVGQYTMLAGTLSALGIAIDEDVAARQISTAGVKR
jgi:alkylhydroperoxidase family enzyme